MTALYHRQRNLRRKILMSEQVLFPRLDQDMDEGILVSWLVSTGDRVHAGDEIAEIETAKVTTTISSPIDGVVLSILVEESDFVPVGTTIAIIGEEGDEVTDLRDPDTTPTSIESGAVPAPSVASVVAPEGRQQIPITQRATALPVDRSSWTRPHNQSPRARFETQMKDLDLGEAMAASVEDRFAAQPAVPSPKVKEGRRVSLSSIRRATIRTVEASWQIPQFSIELEIYTNPMKHTLAKTRQMLPGSGINITDILAIAMTRAIRNVPEVNAWFEGVAIQYFDHVDLNLMIHTDHGLFAPALRSIQSASIAEVAAQRQGLVEAARVGTLASRDLKPGTISLSNLGMYKIDRFNALIYPPQVAVLAVGRIREEEHNSPMWMTLSVDHRAVDGVTAARYLETLGAILSEPLLLIGQNLSGSEEKHDRR